MFKTGTNVFIDTSVIFKLIIPNARNNEVLIKMNTHDIILSVMIEQEKSGEAYVCPNEDRVTVDEIFEKINDTLGTDIHYIAEIDNRIVPGSGRIISDYIHRIKSSGIRAFFILQMVYDKTDNAAEKILKLYMDFKSSGDYISLPVKSDPAHIYVRFDNAFNRLKSRRIKYQLAELLRNPRDLFYLPFTARLLAKWKMPEVYRIVMTYASGDAVTKEAVGLVNEYSDSLPNVECIKRNVIFTCIDSLKYYGGDNAISIIKSYLKSDDKDIKTSADKALLYIMKKRR